MSRDDGDTLSLQESQLSAPRPSRGALVLLLEYQRPTSGSARFSLEGIDEVTIGRGETRSVEASSRRGTRCLHVCVPDPWMSREHARLVRIGEGFRVLDLGSKNGIRVAGARATRTALGDGALLEVGQTAFLFREDAADGSRLLGELASYSSCLADRLRELARVSALDVPILLLGETGTGKELVARAIHRASARRGPFVAVNCAALPATLLEAELFGHKKGAFSGADADRPGLVRSAEGGTLLLDELGELPAAAQAALLRVLDERLVTPVGDARPVPVDFRLLAATNRDLRAQVSAGSFRADLYARLAGLVVTLPALRERREDVGMLIAAILGRHAPGRQVAFTKSAARALLAQPFPHNIRQLDKCLATALGLGADGVIDLDHLKLEPVGPEPEAPLDEAERSERARIVALLTTHGGNVAQVARELGKAPTQVYRWLHRYNIRPGQFRV
jgi:transcriptional regulator with GAF, ATPase, and Fis domain